MVYKAWDKDADDSYDDDYHDETEEDEGDEIPCPHCGRSIYEDAVQCPYCHLYVEGDSALTAPRSGWPLLYRLAAITLLLIFLGPAVMMVWLLFQHGLP